MIDPNENHYAAIKAALVTAATTAGLFTLPAVLPFEELRAVVFDTTGQWWSENPLIQLRFLGGIPGAILAGYWARDEFDKNEWGVGLKYAIYSVTLGIGLFYAGFVAYTWIAGLTGAGPYPTVMYLFVVAPLVLVLPLFPFYVVEAFVAGLVGVSLSRR